MELPAEQVWQCGSGHWPFLLSPVLVQLLGLQTGNKGLEGNWDAAGKAS